MENGSTPLCIFLHGHHLSVTQVIDSTNKPFGSVCAQTWVSIANVVLVPGGDIPLVAVPGEGLQAQVAASNYRYFAGGGVEEDYEKFVEGTCPWSCVRSFGHIS